MKRKQIKSYQKINLLFIILFITSCTSVRNGVTHACSQKLILFNTGLITNGTPSFYPNEIFSLETENTKSSKWTYCLVGGSNGPFPLPNSSFKCQNSTQPIIRDTHTSCLDIGNGTNNGNMQMNNVFGLSKWIIAENGMTIGDQGVYFHVFTNAFCLESSEKSGASDIILNIQTFDSPIYKIIFNGNLIYQEPNITDEIFILQNFTIPKRNLITGINELKIITDKMDLRFDNDFSDDNFNNCQSSGLNVSGYLTITKCCE